MSATSASDTTPARRQFANAEEARSFTGTPSRYNIQALHDAATIHGCHCAPYRDWFTYDRWRAQGLQVMEGEKATRINVYLPPRTTAAGEIQPARTWTAYVFCRCQVTTPDPNRPRRRRDQPPAAAGDPPAEGHADHADLPF